ncbi:MAG: ABC transporter permease [Desulfovibrionaceae bacterium]
MKHGGDGLVFGDGGPDQSVIRAVVLPFRKSVEISVKSLKVRFFRNLITALSLALAVSFVTFVFVTTDTAQGLFESGKPALLDMLRHAGYDVSPGVTAVGGGPKERWIVALSLLVCAVGIVNAQLMAVTERFREIGTMKCLGALDQFILRLFLLEAAMQGVAGSFLGAIFGGLAAVLTGLIRYGSAAATHLSWSAAGLSVLEATGIGLALSLAGVLYPAIVAARMRPVEAMRVEE